MGDTIGRLEIRGDLRRTSKVPVHGLSRGAEPGRLGHRLRRLPPGLGRDERGPGVHEVRRGRGVDRRAHELRFMQTRMDLEYRRKYLHAVRRRLGGERRALSQKWRK